MGRPKKYHVVLNEEDVQRIKKVMKKKEICKTILKRCQILLDLDEAHGKEYTQEQIAKTNCACISTVEGVAKKYAQEGIEGVIHLKRSVNSDNARRKLDGRGEARIVEVACSPAPKGRSRWTLRLLEEQGKVVLDTPVGKDAIGRALKKQTSASQKHLLEHPAERKRRVCSLYGGCSGRI